MSSCSNSGIYSLKQDEVYETPATSAYEQAFETEAAEQNATTGDWERLEQQIVTGS